MQNLWYTILNSIKRFFSFRVVKCIVNKISIAVFISSAGLLYPASSCAQNSSGFTIMAGTQFPLQYTLGTHYQINNRFSVRAQAGLLTKPYDRFFINSLEAFGLEQELSEISRASFELGTLASLGGNYHFKKNYIGLYGQYTHIEGSATVGELLQTKYGAKFPAIDPQWLVFLEPLEVNSRSDILAFGLLYGRKFILPNPRFEISAEAGISKIISSHTQLSAGYDFIDQADIVKVWYDDIGNRFKEAYWQYGYLPYIGLYLTYKLSFKPSPATN